MSGGEPGGGRMMQRQGAFTMYDDGTHGDRVPGDGIYCYEDDRACAGSVPRSPLLT